MLLFILCGVYIWKWVERVREIRVETRRGFRRFVKWNDGRTRYCLYIAGIPISFFFFCCRCDALFIVAMYFFFFWSPYPLLSFWTEISFSVRVLCLFFLLLEYLAQRRRAIFASTSLNRFLLLKLLLRVLVLYLYRWNQFYLFMYSRAVFLLLQFTVSKVVFLPCCIRECGKLFKVSISSC